MHAPLIVPEVNSRDIKKAKLISNPNCVVIMIALPLYHLHKQFKIQSLTVTTFQAVSGAGLNPTFAHPIFNNLIPHIEGEEEKIEAELKKILQAQNICIIPTCVRVPITNCHSAALTVTCQNKISPDIFKNKPGIALTELPMPITANNTDEVYIGRIRKHNNHTLSFFTCADNLRKGAATNAVQILEQILGG
jgi:aspartate-semialdehyde dehydrogenase